MGHFTNNGRLTISCPYRKKQKFIPSGISQDGLCCPVVINCPQISVTKTWKLISGSGHRSIVGWWGVCSLKSHRSQLTEQPPSQRLPWEVWTQTGSSCISNEMLGPEVTPPLLLTIRAVTRPHPTTRSTGSEILPYAVQWKEPKRHCGERHNDYSFLHVSTRLLHKSLVNYCFKMQKKVWGKLFYNLGE